MGSRYSDFTMSFKLAIRTLLTSCSKEDFAKAFPNFNRADQQSLYELFIQVITSLHKIIQEEFELVCLENQVGETLDIVDQHVEEQRLDPLFSNRTNVIDVARDLTTEKQNEVQRLVGMIERVEEQNRLFRARIELLKKERQVISGTADAEKLQSGISKYWTSSDGI